MRKSVRIDHKKREFVWLGLLEYVIWISLISISRDWYSDISFSYFCNFLWIDWFDAEKAISKLEQKHFVKVKRMDYQLEAKAFTSSERIDYLKEIWKYDDYYSCEM